MALMSPLKSEDLVSQSLNLSHGKDVSLDLGVNIICYQADLPRVEMRGALDLSQQAHHPAELC